MLATIASAQASVKARFGKHSGIEVDLVDGRLTAVLTIDFFDALRTLLGSRNA